MTVTEQSVTEQSALIGAPEVSDFLVKLALSKPQDANARQVYEWAIGLDYSNAEARNALGRMYLTAREYSKAAELFNAALHLDYGNLVYATNYSLALRNEGRNYEAIVAIREAVELKYVPALIQMASIHEADGDIEKALHYVQMAIEEQPENDECLFYRGILRAKLGAWYGAWSDMEHRPTRLQLSNALDEWPEWTGQDLTGKTILVCREQGMGDEIMFARFVSELKRRAGKVIYYAYPNMARIMARLAGVDEVVSEGWELGGKFDYWVGSGSLAKRMGVSFGPRFGCDYEWRGGALVNPLEDARFDHIIPDNGTLRVGLCWAGNADHKNDHNRSMRFDDMRLLLDIKGCTFYSLQFGTERAQSNVEIPEIAAYCHDLFDTACAISNLDLVITVDTAVAHLAGMMGMPVWMLQGKIPDWRWSAELYPSMRVYAVDGHLSDDGYLRMPAIWTVAKDVIRMAKDWEWERSSLYCVNGPRKGLPGERAGAPAPRETIITKPCRYGQMSWYANDTYIGRALAQYAEYSESEAELLRSVLAPGDVVIEAGANIGGLTLPMVKHGAVVHAFEPQWAYFKLLGENVPGTILHPRALGSTDSKITLRSIELELIHAPGWKSTGDEFKVDQFTIDSLGLNPNIIKIDVDGQEHDILIGAEQTIARSRPLIYVEHDKPNEYPHMLEWIHEHRYRIYRHSAPLFNPNNFAGNPVNVFGNIVSLMLLCVPMERYDLRSITDKLERVKIGKR